MISLFECQIEQQTALSNEYTLRQLDEDWELPVDLMATQQQTVGVCGLGGQQHCQNVFELFRARDIPQGLGANWKKRLNRKERSDNGRRERESTAVP